MFFKNVLLAAAASTFLFLDTQTFLCLSLAFSLSRVEVAENVCRQSWLGACPVRLGWERVASEVGRRFFIEKLRDRRNWAKPPTYPPNKPRSKQ